MIFLVLLRLLLAPKARAEHFEEGDMYVAGGMGEAPLPQLN